MKKWKYLAFIINAFFYCTSYSQSNDCVLDLEYPMFPIDKELLPCALENLEYEPAMHWDYNSFNQGKFGYDVVTINKSRSELSLNRNSYDDITLSKIDSNTTALRLNYDNFNDIDLSTFNQLQYLDLFSVKSTVLPTGLENLKNLKFLKISVSHLDSIPNIFNGLKSLETLIIDYADDVVYLPNSIKSLKNLKFLDLSRFHKIDSLPFDFSQFKELKRLHLIDNGNEFCNRSVLKLPKLRYLILDNHPEFVYEIPTIEILRIGRIRGEKDLKGIEKLKHLKELSIVYYSLDTASAYLTKLESLKALHIESLSSLSYFPKQFENLKKLEYLSIYSKKVNSLPLFVQGLENLKYLRLNTGGTSFSLMDDSFKNITPRYIEIICKCPEGTVNLNFPDKTIKFNNRRIYY